MRAFLLQHVVADRLVLDHDARIEVFLLLDDRNDVRRDIRLDADGIEAAVRRNLVLDVGGRHVDELRKALDHVVLDRRRQRQERDREAWAVRHEELAVAVIERAARRHRRDDADAVAIRKPCIVIALINLQVPRTPDQNGDDEHHADAEDAETALVAVVSFIFQNISPKKQGTPTKARGACKSNLLFFPRPFVDPARNRVHGIGKNQLIEDERHEHVLRILDQVEAIP